METIASHPSDGGAPRRSRRWVLPAMSAAVASCFLVSACGSSSSHSAAAASSSSTAATTNSTLIAVTVGTEQPFAFTSPSGRVEGFSIDLTNKIAAALHMKVDYKLASLDNLLSGLTNHQYDICACALQVTAAREKTLTFSESYYYASLSIVANSSEHLNMASGLAGKTLAVQTDSAEQKYAETHYPKAQLKEYPDQATALTALKANEVDAFLVGEPSVPGYLAQDSSLESIATIPLTAPNAFPIELGNTNLANEVNTQLNQLFADGYYAADYHKWFGKNVPLPSLLVQQHPSLKN